MTSDSKSPAESTVQQTVNDRRSTDNRCMPLSLRIVAYVFVVTGVMSIVEMLLQWFILSTWMIDPLFPCLIIGRGLLDRENVWRRWALIFTYSAIAGCLFMAVYVVATGNEVPPLLLNASPESLPGVFLLLAYLIWQLYVLHRTDIAAEFKGPRLHPPEGKGGVTYEKRRVRWQFSLESLLVAMVATAFMLMQFSVHPALYPIQLVSTAPNCVYGIRASRFGQSRELAYVVFESTGASSRVYTFRETGMRLGGWKEWHGVYLPNNETLLLPGKHQLYEVVDGILRTRDERVALAELENYMASQPPAKWSLDALVKHAEEMRARPPAQGGSNNP